MGSAMRYIVNEFDEVVPVINGRVSTDTRERRPLTGFEEDLLEEIDILKDEIKKLQEKE